VEGQEDLGREILIKKGVKSVTDMIYEARVSAVIRIEATHGRACPRKTAIGMYPTADEYNSV
jgi:hypothetical protein